MKSSIISKRPAAKAALLAAAKAAAGLTMLLAFLTVAACTSPSKGSDVPELDPKMLPSKELSIGSYTRLMNVDVKEAIRIRFTTEVSVPTLYASNNNHKYFTYEVVDDTLKVRHYNGGEVFFLSGASFLYLPPNSSLKEISTNGPVVFESRFKGGDLRLATTSATGSFKGDFDLEGTLEASLDGGKFLISGKAWDLSLNCASGKFCPADGEESYQACSFQCARAVLNVGEYASLGCSSKMTGNIGSAGTVDYSGECDVKGVSIEEGGKLNKVN